MNPPHLDFRYLKQRVSIEQVLANNSVTEGFRRRGDRLVGPCPIHGGDNPRAFVADLERNTWFCFSRCGRGGDIVELVRLLGHPDYREAACYLASLVGQRSTLLPGPPQRSSTPQAGFRPFTRRLPLDPGAPMLARKGIEPATARRFEAGTYHGRGFLRGCLGVRLHDSAGRPIGYAGRRLDEQQVRQFGKWKMARRLPKSRLLYSWHRVVRALPMTLIVVEDPWSVMRLFQLGLPAVSLLGIHLSEHQRCLLSEVPHVILMLDGDEAGREATRRILRELGQYVTVAVVSLPDGLDPDDLSDDRLLALLRPLFFL